MNRYVKSERFLRVIIFIVNVSIIYIYIGVYWRGSPETGKSAPSNDNWPRNGALLKGTGPHFIKGENWMKVTEIQQAKESQFKKVPEGIDYPYIILKLLQLIFLSYTYIRHMDDVRTKWATFTGRIRRESSIYIQYNST